MAGNAGAIREVAAVFGVEFDDAQLRRGIQSVNGAVGAIRALGAALVGTEIVRGVRDFVQEFTEAGSALNDASDNLGVTTQHLQELEYAAGQAGVRGGQLDAALSSLSAKLGEAHAGGGRAGEAFHALGVRVTDASGRLRNANDVMTDIAAGMDRIPDPARRVALASDIFGRAGRRLVGVLHEGSGGLSEMRQQFQDLGGGLSDAAVHAADDYGDSLERLRVAQMGLKSMIGVFLLPALTSVTDWASHAIATFHRLTDGTHVLQEAGAALGVGLAAAAAQTIAAWLPVIAPFLALVAVIGLAIAVVDDLWTAYEGGDSVLGRIEGVNTAMRQMHDLVDGVKLAWANLKLAELEALDVLIRFLDSTPGLSRVISMLTGRSVEAQQAHDREFMGDRLSRLRSEVASLQGGSGQIVQNAGPAGAVDPRAAAKAVRDIVFERTVGRGAQTVPVAASTVARQTTVNQHTSVGPTTFNIHGIQNPREMADYIERRQRERRNAENDANHPRLPDGE